MRMFGSAHGANLSTLGRRSLDPVGGRPFTGTTGDLGQQAAWPRFPMPSSPRA